MRSSSTSPDPKGPLHSRGVKHCQAGQQRAAPCRLSRLVTPQSTRRMPGREDPCPHLPAPKSEPSRFAQRCRHPKSCLHLWDSPGSPALPCSCPCCPLVAVRARKQDLPHPGRDRAAIRNVSLWVLHRCFIPNLDMLHPAAAAATRAHLDALCWVLPLLRLSPSSCRFLLLHIAAISSSPETSLHLPVIRKNAWVNSDEQTAL